MSNTQLINKIDALINAINTNRGNFGGGSRASNTGGNQNTRENDLSDTLEIQSQINENTENYFLYLDRIKKSKKEISLLEKKQNDSLKRKISLQAKLYTAISRGDANQQAALQAQIDDEETLNGLIEERLDNERRILSVTSQGVKNSRNLAVTTSKIRKDYGKIKDSAKTWYNYLGVSEIFAMSKSIKVSAAQMGILSNQSGDFSKHIQNVANQTISFGIGIEEIAKAQASFSDEMGTTALLSENALKNISAIGLVTGIGSEGMSKIAADMESVGVSAEMTGKYFNDIATDSRSMGLNTTKLIKNLSSNIKFLNKFNFKGGAKGLGKMAESTTKMGITMESIGSAAEKLFDIEGAVEMSSKLQVLGGSWAKLADPFKLMYMARNDMAGLTDEIINATKAEAKFNEKTKEFDISSANLQRLREVSQALGVDFDTLATSAKKAAKFASINKQIGFGIKDESVRNFIETQAFLDDNGKAKIMIDGNPKFLKDLTSIEKNKLFSMSKEKEDFIKRAESTRTFGDSIDNTITLLKQLALPIIEAFNKSFTPVVDKFTNWIKDPKNIKVIQDVTKKISDLIVDIGKWVTDNPIKSIGATLGAFLLGSTAGWIANGVSLAVGFKMGMKGFNLLGNLFGRGVGATGAPAAGGGSSILGSGLKAGGALAAVSTAKDLFDFFSSSSMRKTGGAGFLESLGGAGASIFSPLLGGLYNSTGLAIPELGVDDTANARAVYRNRHPNAKTMISNSDLIKDIQKNPNEYPSEFSNKVAGTKINDGIIFNKNDKFIGNGNGSMIAGTNVNGNKDLAKAILSTKTPSFEKSGYLLGNKGSNQKNNTNNINLSGNIDLKYMGSSIDKDFGRKLVSNPLFIRELSLHISKSFASSNGKNN